MVESTRAARIKILFAVAGGGAVLAMGAVAVMVDESLPVTTTPVAAPVLPGPMTEGATSMTSAPASVLATAKAAPAVKAKRFGE